MSHPRVFRVADHLQPSDGEPIRSVVHATGQTVHISAGDVVVAPTGAVHGVLNNGAQALVFVSVVSPANAGY